MQNIFRQILTISCTLIFYGYNLHKKTMEESEILNPFGYGKASKVLHENRKPVEWWIEYTSINQVIAENEFYVLFDDGLLVKKGRSKFTTSQYIKGDKFTSFGKVYARV